MSVGDQKWKTPYPIEHCVLVGDKVVVIYEHSSGKTWGQFRNLEAFSLAGRQLWTAEHPTNETADAYVRVLALDPLTVLNFAGFVCQLDEATGKILKKEFIK